MISFGLDELHLNKPYANRVYFIQNNILKFLSAFYLSLV